MAYKPTLADLGEETKGYTPSLSDIPDDMESRPSIPFDPADQTPTGGYVPPGTYNTPGARVASEFMSSLLVPEFNALKPLLASGARALTGGAINTATSALNPDNKNSLLKTGAQNLGLNALIESVPYAGKALAWLTSGVRPAAHAQDVLDNLGQGAQTLEQNGKSLAQDIKNAHAGHEAIVKSYLDPVSKKYGDDLIYRKAVPDKKGQLSLFDSLHEKPEFPSLKDEHEVGEVYDAFAKNPTFNNTHKLQQALGFRIGKLQRMPMNTEIEKKISQLKESRDTLLDGMEGHLEDVDPNSAKQWENGINYFKENILPYRSDTTIENIVKGKETNPKNIHSLFEYPTERMDYITKQNMMGPIEKIVSDLPPSSIGKILYSRIGGHLNNRTPERLISSIEKARNSGHSSYITPKLDDAMESLSNKVKNRNALEHVVGGLSGLGAGHAMGLGPQADIELSALSGYLAPRVINKITGMFPGKRGSNPLAQYLGTMFNPAARTAGVEGINALGNQ